jgi:polysaccharide biosynthesis protein PslH
MKILWVKAGGFVPPDFGGRIRSYQIAKELARSHEVTLYTFYADEPDDPHRELSKIFKRVECRPLRLPAGRGLGNAVLYARAFLSLRPYTMFKFCKPWMARDLRRLIREDPCDVIVCDFAAAGGVIPWELPCPKVLFTHNVEAQIWNRHYQVARNPIWKLVCWREYRSMARAERAYLERADHVLSVSEADRELFSTVISRAKITVIPTGVDADYFHPSDTTENPGELVFTGSMDWLANEDAIYYFVEQVLPLIRRDVPEATLTVVGRRPSPRLQALAATTPSLRVTGRVEDIRPYVWRAAVYVVPLRVGGGTRLKIFEAMAMGKAIVSTAVGAEGLNVRSGQDIVLADDPPSFAERVVHLLQHEPERRALGEAAARKARQYDWSWVAGQFVEVLSRVIQTGSIRGSAEQAISPARC